MIIVNLILWTGVFLGAIGTLLVVANIGKPRGPITPGLAVWVVGYNTVFYAALIVGLLR